jgi:hypothetical protein
MIIRKILEYIYNNNNKYNKMTIFKNDDLELNE